MASGAIVYYLLIYSLSTMGIFGVLVWLSRRGHDVETLDDLKGLMKHDPLPAYTLLFFLLSLGGVPPLAGFWGKWYIFIALSQSGHLGLALTLAITSVVAVFYYMKIAWVVAFQEPDSSRMGEPAKAEVGVSFSLAIAVGLSVLLGVAPNLVQPLMSAASTLIRP